MLKRQPTRIPLSAASDFEEFEEVAREFKSTENNIPDTEVKSFAEKSNNRATRIGLK